MPNAELEIVSAPQQQETEAEHVVALHMLFMLSEWVPEDYRGSQKERETEEEQGSGRERDRNRGQANEILIKMLGQITSESNLFI